MKVRVLTLCLALAAVPALSQAATCQPTNETEIAALFDRWNEALQTRDSQKVVALYAKDSVLLPTLSNTPRLTAEAKIDYFDHFLAKSPVGSVDSRSVQIDCTSAVASGLYTFKFADGSQAAARYTYTYGWDGKQWLITSHHSSAMPEKL